MTSTYATVYDLEERLSAVYLEAGLPSDVEKLLEEASEVVNYATLNRAETVWGLDDADLLEALTDATCAQVEFELEVGPEHNVAGLTGSLVAGRVQIHPVAGTLSPRAKRILSTAGLYWEGAAIG